MKKWRLAAVWTAACFTGQGAVTLAVLADFEQQPSGLVLEAAQRELSALLVPADLSVAWHTASTFNFLGRTYAVVAVRFTGACRLDPVRSPYPVTGVMAWTARVDGNLQPLIEVNCGRIASYVRAANPGELGWAIARVLAHELYHYLTQEVAHTRSVLFSHSIRARDLTTGGIRFDSDEIEVLRRALAGLPAVAPPKAA
jgi:hypothetical protein